MIMTAVVSEQNTAGKLMYRAFALRGCDRDTNNGIIPESANTEYMPARPGLPGMHTGRDAGRNPSGFGWPE